MNLKGVYVSKQFFLKGVYIGKVAQRYGLDTGINKSLVTNSLYLSPKGLAYDACADLDHHGGVERALHQYPLEHYSYWRQKYNKIVNSKNWEASGMGENLSSIGMTENTVCLGDQYQWGEAIIELSQPRSPCFKLNKRWGIEGLSLEMQKLGLCGWLYRVIQPGMVSIDEPLKLIDRAPKAMTIREVCDIFFGNPLCNVGLLQLKQQNTLSDSWMNKVIQRLETGKVEDWGFRLLGADAIEKVKR